MDETLKKLKVSLIDDLDQCAKYMTVWFNGLLVLIAGFSPVVVKTWETMPESLKEVLPHNVQQALSYAALFTTLIAMRVVKVERVPK